MEPGLYDKYMNLVYSWKKLIENGMVTIDKNDKNNIIDINICNDEANLVLPENITKFYLSHYDSIRLNTLYIPKKLTELTTFVMQCIENIEVDKDNPLFYSKDGILYKENALLRCPRFHKKKILEIKEGTNIIAKGAFINTENIEELICPDSVTKIGNNCFQSCDIKKIILPKNLEIISGGTFRDSPKLEKVINLSNIETIGNNAFANCTNLNSITLSTKLTTLGFDVFIGCDNLKINYCGNEKDFAKIKNALQINPKNIIFNYTKTLDDLINEGKSIREANKILKEQEERAI